MKAINDYVIVKLVEEKSEIVRPSGIVLMNGDETKTTNNGDNIRVKTKFIVVDAADEHSDLLNKEVILNGYELQMFENDDTAYGVVPYKEIKVVL